MGTATIAANLAIWPNFAQAPGVHSVILTKMETRGATLGFRARGDIPKPIFLPPGVKVLVGAAQCNFPLPLPTITLASPRLGHPSLWGPLLGSQTLITITHRGLLA